MECSQGAHLPCVVEPIGGYATSVTTVGMTIDLSSWRALPICRYSFLVPLRVDGAVGLSGWLRNKSWSLERSPSVSVITGLDLE